jgi:DNA-binding beta-propeller fold protein YncE
MRITAGREDTGSVAAAALAALATFALALLLAAPNASAAPPQLWQTCETGSGAGQCLVPRGIAADPDNGHVFVGDPENNRIVEFDPLGEFVKAWGWDVVASGPGDDTTAPEDQFEVCVPEDGDVCKKGTHGAGKGQFGLAGPQGLAVDSAGNVYVVDRGLPSNQRVQKFSPAGQFLLMFGGEVNKTKTEEPGSTKAQRNLCTAASGDECQAGTEGTGQGQFGEWPSIGDWIAIDDKGTETAADDAVYAGDENRIQTFDVAGAYQSQFAVAGTVGGLATDTAGDLYAIYGGKVHKLSPSGEPLTPETFEIPKLTPSENPLAAAVAVSDAGNVFVFGPTLGGSASAPRHPIFEFDPAGNVIDEFGKGEFQSSTGIATNLCEGSEAPGNLYVSNPDPFNSFLRAYGTNPVGCFKARTLPASEIEETAATLNGSVDPGGSLTSECRFRYGTTTEYGASVPCAESPAQIGEGNDPVPVHADLGGLTKGTVYHFRLRAEIKGVAESGADETFKTLGPPVISDDRLLSAAYAEATLKALVNPEGFATSYSFQYTTEADFEAEGFEGAQSTPLASAGSQRKDHVAIANLTELSPGTTYRWRVLATNSSGETEGQVHAFHTYRTFAPQTDCPNQAFRTGPAAFLPDCRAYEMVSPIDKNGADIANGLSGPGNPGAYVQASVDGERLAYGTLFASFAGQPSSFKFNQYLASRNQEGWSNEGIRPPVRGHLCCEGLGLSFGVIREFSAFSPDLCNAWLVDTQAPTLNADAQQGYPNLYRRDNCGADAGELQTLTASPPALPAGTQAGYVNIHSVQGLSGDSRHAVFVARARLAPEAAEGASTQIYDRFEGATRLVSVLPSGEANKTQAVVGSGPPGADVGSGNLDNAVSEDGSRVYWSALTPGLNEIGKIYLRTNPEQGIVGGECTKATKACTLAVSTGIEAFFWTAAADGSKALFSEGAFETASAKLYEFDLAKAEAEEPPRRLVAENVKGVAGASEDLSRIYFVSTAALPGSGQNSEGEEAAAGKPNLYLDESGAKSFVATLVAGDVGALEPGTPFPPYNLVSREPYERATRVTPDGSRIAFNSRAPLSGYDSTDPESGKPAVEVFSYEIGGELSCVSCNPGGARPGNVRELRLPYRPPFELNVASDVPAAAWIPTWEHKLHASNVMSEDGSSIFFNANDALIPRDTNGAQDVYQWQAAGSGDCEEDSPSYFPQNGGCLHLISSGESPSESEFWEASPDGSNVFFTTASSLLPQDPGSVDLYDARVEGGFPQPSEPAACEGEACQSPPGAPNASTPASTAFEGEGNVKEAKPRPRCPKGKRRVVRRGKARCVKRKGSSQQKQRKANSNRGAKR